MDVWTFNSFSCVVLLELMCESLNQNVTEKKISRKTAAKNDPRMKQMMNYSWKTKQSNKRLKLMKNRSMEEIIFRLYHLSAVTVEYIQLRLHRYRQMISPVRHHNIERRSSWIKHEAREIINWNWVLISKSSSCVFHYVFKKRISISFRTMGFSFP